MAMDLETKTKQEETKQSLVDEGALPLSYFAGYLYKDNKQSGKREIYAPVGNGAYYLRNELDLA